jgi:manganese transport protein
VNIKKFFNDKQKPDFMALDFIKYIGPGFLVTVGFIDPGNWASNVSAGSDYGYKLLWMVTLSTIMLIILQHNAAHLGITTGYCLSEAASIFINNKVSKFVLLTALASSVSTALAELLGGAIALNMLFRLPIKIGTIIMVGVICWMLFTNSYKKLEKWIIGFVSIIGASFIFELTIVNVTWKEAVVGWVTPSMPSGSLPIIMSVLGAVVMPHNLFLHSEIIQSRQWNLKDKKIIRHQLKYEFLDTLFSMIIGWAINSAMIIVAAATFNSYRIKVTELNQAQQMLIPLIGNSSAVIFAIALLFSGISSSVTAGMAGGSIFAGIYKEPYDIHDKHTSYGVLITLLAAGTIILFISNPFNGLIISQMVLSIQLPITIVLQIFLTSSKKVMGEFVNTILDKILLIVIAIIVITLNLLLLANFL